MRTVLILCAAAALFACGEDESTTPEPEPTPDPTPDQEPDTPPDCLSLGGGCVGIGECNVGSGHLSDDVECTNANLVCCVPQGNCGQAEEDFQCCSDTSQNRPTCRNGALICIEGTERCD